MRKHILIIDGHPDARAERFVHALSKSYWDGARSGGYEIKSITVSEVAFPMLRTSDEFESGTPGESIRKCQKVVAWADHLVILFPLWLGSMPALLKGFLAQVLRPGFAFAPGSDRGFPKKLLAGKTARIVVTMGMPALFYRWYSRAHSIKSLERNILKFCGISRIRVSIVGGVKAMGPAGRGKLAFTDAGLGRRGF